MNLQVRIISKNTYGLKVGAYFYSYNPINWI
jgi:hypothetical protein